MEGLNSHRDCRLPFCVAKEPSLRCSALRRTETKLPRRKMPRVADRTARNRAPDRHARIIRRYGAPCAQHVERLRRDPINAFHAVCHERCRAARHADGQPRAKALLSTGFFTSCARGRGAALEWTDPQLLVKSFLPFSVEFELRPDVNAPWGCAALFCVAINERLAE
jgi:hypothetical protein